VTYKLKVNISSCSGQGKGDEMDNYLSIFKLFGVCFLILPVLLQSDGMFKVDIPGIVAHNDVVYLSPARQGWEGMPIGNGTLGAMVWHPEELVFQLNTPLSGVYGGAVCRLKIGTSPGMMVGMGSYRQQLSLYTSTLNTEISGVSGSVNVISFIPADADALIVQYKDTRNDIKERFLEVETWRKSASVFSEDDTVLVTDVLKHKGEPDYRFAVVVGLETEKNSSAVASGKRLTVTGDRFTVLLAFAGTRDSNVNVAAEAKNKLSLLRTRRIENIQKSHQEWWRRFWEKSFIKIDSGDAAGDYIANLWYMHIYAMGAGSRGEVPPKFNGGLWTDNYDAREWGSHFWHWNTQETYWPLYAANHLELIKPYYDMYWNMLPVVKQWTREIWELDGAQYQETIPFNGVMGKWQQERGAHPRVPIPKNVAHTNLIFSSSAEIAMQFWWHYLYTGDETFLSDRTYPLMREVVRFLVGYLEKDSRGYYCMEPSNAHESFWKVKNPTTDLSAIRYIFQVFIDLSRRLNLDEKLRADCQERLDHLVPYPVSTETGAITPYELKSGEEMKWRNAENPDLFPIGVFPNILLGSTDYELGLKTFYNRRNVNGYGWTTDSIAAARLGLSNTSEKEKPAQYNGLEYLLPLHATYYQNYPCGLQDYYLRKPGMHPYLEGSGTMSTGVGEMLLQGWNGVLRICPALPDKWSADFKLLAMGGFEVTCHAEKGTVRLVQIKSHRGMPVKIVNPFNNATVVTMSGRQVLKSEAGLLEFKTEAGKTYVISPLGIDLTPLHISAEPNRAPKHLAPGSRRWIGRNKPASAAWIPPVEPEAPQPPGPVDKVERAGNPEVIPAFFDHAPEIDADLSEPVWQTATSLGHFLIQGKKNVAAEQTDVRFGYDSRAIYLGITCWESRMSYLIAESAAGEDTRDSEIFRDDSIEIFLQPGTESYWHFAVNVLGAVYDTYRTATTDNSFRINLDWQVAAKRYSNRWVVEAAIPFDSVVPEYPVANESWGFNIGRNEKPHGEISTFAPMSEPTFHNPRDFARLFFPRGTARQPQAVTSSDMVGYWTFEDIRNTWLVDSSGHRNHGLLVGLVKQVSGKVGKSMEFSGRGFVEIADAESLNLTDAMTLALWVCPMRKGSMRLLDKCPAGGADGYMLDTYPDNNLRLVTRIGGCNVKKSLPVNEWSHVAVTLGHGNLLVYLNGEPVLESRVPDKPLTVTGLPLHIGADSSGRNCYAGLMDEVRIYRRVLSSEEIASLIKP
jgi:alpha-L-fucosidase 2